MCREKSFVCLSFIYFGSLWNIIVIINVCSVITEIINLLKDVRFLVFSAVLEDRYQNLGKYESRGTF